MTRKSPEVFTQSKTTKQASKSSEFQEKVVELRDRLNDILFIKKQSEHEMSSAEFQVAVSAIYGSLLKLLCKEKARDIDFVVLNPEVKPETCFWIWWHPVDSGAQIDMWIKWKEDDAVSIAFNREWQFIIKPTKNVSDRELLPIKAIPELILSYCMRWNRWITYKVIKWNIVLVPMDERMHRLAQQPPRHLRQFWYISESTNSLEVHQMELYKIFQYLEWLCRDNWIIDNKEILEIDLHPDYIHPTKKPWLICIRKNWDLFELWITWESSWNIVFYKDKKWIYCIRKSWAKSSFSKNKRNKLLGAEAIPWPIRDFIEYEWRLEEAKISTLIRSPIRKFAEFTDIGIFSHSAVQNFQVLGPKWKWKWKPYAKVIENFFVPPIIARWPWTKKQTVTSTLKDPKTWLDIF